MIINNRDNRRLLLRCFLLAIIAFSKPAAAQSNRPFSPGLLIFDAEAGGPIQTQAAVLLNQEPFVSLLATSSCPWATIPSGRISGRNLFVTVNPLLGATGINTCNILVTREVGGASVGTLPVTLNLGNTGLAIPSSGIAAPVSLTFSSDGSNNPSPQTIAVNAPGDFSVAVTYAKEPQFGDENFLSAAADVPAGKVVVSFNRNGSGLARGATKGLVYIETSAGTALVQVNVVSPQFLGASQLTLQSSQPVINFKYQSGGPSPNTSFTVSSSCDNPPRPQINCDGTPTPLSLTSPANWITIAPPAAQATPATYGLSVNPATLPNGFNTAVISVAAAGAQSGFLTIPVSVWVSGSSAPGGRNGSSLIFGATANGVPAASQALNISNWQTDSYAAAAATSNGNSAWLKISPAGQLKTATDTSITVTANPAGLGAGTYTGNILLTSQFIQQTIPITFQVSPASVTPGLTVSPNALNFLYQGGSAPASQPYAITGPAGSPPVSVAVAAQTQNGGNWLSSGAAGGVVNSGATLLASVIPGNLGPGTYKGSIVLTPSGGTSVTVPVTLTVLPLQAAAVTPASLTFDYRVGESVPASQVVQVSGSGGVAFAVHASSGADWLTVTPAAGTISSSGSTLTVAVNPTNLAAGIYRASFTVTDATGATAAATASVSLNVSAPLPTVAKVVNAASYAAGPIAAGELLTIFGTNLGPDTGVPLALDPAGRVASTLGGVQVLVGGFPAPLIYVSRGQVSAIAPYEIGRPFLLSPSLVIKYLGQSSNPIALTQAGAAPGIFTANSSGTGAGAILNSDFSLNSPANPAAPGEIVQIYMTGEGQTTPAGVSGSITGVSATGPLTPQPVLRVSVAIDDQPAAVEFFGEAPNLVAGLMQLNVRIPPNARPGNLPVGVTLADGDNGSASQPGVTVAVR